MESLLLTTIVLSVIALVSFLIDTYIAWLTEDFISDEKIDRIIYESRLDLLKSNPESFLKIKQVLTEKPNLSVNLAKIFN